MAAVLQPAGIVPDKTSLLDRPHPRSATTVRAGAVLCTAGAAAVFGADLLTPPGFGIPFLYIPIVWAALWWATRRQVIAIAGVCALLTVLVPLLMASPFAWPWVVNRTIVLIVLGFVVYFGLVYREAVDTSHRHEQDLADLVDHAPSGVFWLDMAGVILGANHEQLRVLGYAEEEFVGHRIQEFAADASAFDTCLAGAISDPAASTLKASLRHRDGTPRHFVISANRRIDHGVPVGLRCFARDVTDHLRAEAAESERNQLALLNERLRESEELLRITLDNAPSGINIVDPEGRFLQANPAYQQMLGYTGEELRSRTAMELTHPEDLPRNLQLRRELLDGKRDFFEIEKRYFRKDGTIIWVRNRVSRVLDGTGRPRFTVAVVHDITQYRKQARALRAMEERFRLIVAGVRDYAIFTLDPDGNVTSWNAGAQRINGYAAGEILGRNFGTFYPPPDVAAGLPERHLRTALENGSVEHEGWRVRKDGSRFWANAVMTRINDESGKPGGFVKITRDVTDRKQTEERLRAMAADLSALAVRLVDAQESERRNVSRELHDRVGQTLTALNLNLDLLRGQLSVQPHDKLAKIAEDSILLVRETMDCIEDVMKNLRPPILDDYGLMPALRWHATEFEARTGITADVSGTMDGRRLPPQHEIALFRIAQEALNNVAKHAKAASVTVCVARRADAVELTVRDDGVGFDDAVQQESGRRSGWGTQTMRERARALGGTLEVRSAAGTGCCVTATVPVPS